MKRGENLFVFDCVLISNDDKLLAILDQLRHILAEKRERRVGDHDIGLFQKFNAFLAAEVAVAFEIAYAYLFRVWYAVAVLVACVFEPNGSFGIVLAEKVALLTLVACRDEPLQAQPLKLVGEIVEEVGNTRIVAIAENRLALEVFLVVGKLALDVLKAGVELVLFLLLRPAKAAIVVLCHIMFCRATHAPRGMSELYQNSPCYCAEN